MAEFMPNTEVTVTMPGPTPPDGDGSEDTGIDQAKARIERAEMEGRKEAVEKYAQKRREEAAKEELQRLRGDESEGKATEKPGFFEWVGGGLRRLGQALKKVDQQMVESHSNNDDTDSSQPGLGADREPSMPDPLGGDSQPEMPDSLSQETDGESNRFGP